MPDDRKKTGSRVYPWRLLIKSYLKGDELPFYQHFFKLVSRNKLVKSNEILWREIYAFPYIENLVGDIYSEKIYGKRCLDNWLLNTKKYDDDGIIQASIETLINNYVISITRQKNRLKIVGLEEIHDGHLYEASQNAENDYQGIAHSGAFDNPERILELKEFAEDLDRKKTMLYGRLNEKQVFIFENSKKFEKGEMTYEEIAQTLGVATVTVQTNATKIEKIIEEIIKD